MDRGESALASTLSVRPEPFGLLGYDWSSRRLVVGRDPLNAARAALPELLETGLDAPICISWELTYACNLACRHCLSSSGRRDPAELTTEQCEGLVDELAQLRVFYVNVGGGEPTLRPDFWHLLDYATGRGVGVKFSTNGVRLTRARAQRLAQMENVDVQVSLDGATQGVNDRVRGPGSYRLAIRALEALAAEGFVAPKVSVVVTRDNVPELDALRRLADSYGATLRLTRFRPSGRGRELWDEMHPTGAQQRYLYDWLIEHGDGVLTGDSFFHLGAFGQALPGLGMCGAGRVVCLVDPVGDVYACPFTLDATFLAGNVLQPGGLRRAWQQSPVFQRMRTTDVGPTCASCQGFEQCRGGCAAAKHFTGLSQHDPDPECVKGLGDLAKPAPGRSVPVSLVDHSRGTGRSSHVRACDPHPLAGA